MGCFHLNYARFFFAASITFFAAIRFAVLCGPFGIFFGLTLVFRFAIYYFFVY